MSDDFDREVARSLMDTLWLPRPWSLSQFVAHLELERRRPIRIMDIDPTVAPNLATRVTGLWKPQDGYDLILVSSLVDANHREHVVAHELGHILLWSHHQRNDPPTLHYLIRTFPHLPKTLLARQALALCAARTAFEHPVERQAEWFALMLGAAAEDRKRPIVRPDAPPRARIMAERAAAVFGWK